MQSALAKERRELQQQQQRTLLEAIPKDLSRPWEDPMPEEGERHLAAELRGLGMSATTDEPEWKVAALGKAPTFGIKDSRSILEQRQSLPIYALKEPLVQAVKDNQVGGVSWQLMRCMVAKEQLHSHACNIDRKLHGMGCGA